MTTKVYFENTKTGRRFEVVAVSEDGATITLRGEFAEFSEPYNKEQFKQMGYKLVRVEVQEPEDA